MRRLLVFLMILLVLGCERGSAPAPPRAAVSQLDARFEPLMSDFEAAGGKVRVLALLSPT